MKPLHEYPPWVPVLIGLVLGALIFGGGMWVGWELMQR